MELGYEEIALIAKEIVRSNSPRDTGNLADWSIKLENRGSNIWAIIVDENVAPYMKYTNENWNNFAYPLHGKKNPNEGWWDKTAGILARELANILGGTIKTEG